LGDPSCAGWLARPPGVHVYAGGMAAEGTDKLFLAGARTVAAAIEDPVVMAAWDTPSVLEEQLVSGLAGHLARGSVWVVADYVSAGIPSAPVDFGSAASYFAAVSSVAGPSEHQAVRERGAAVASVGAEQLATTLRDRIAELETILSGAHAGQLISVIGGRVMYLSDYLATRIVEQAVHLDDLARSVGVEPSFWSLPPGHVALVIEVGIETAILRAGEVPVLRALYRDGFAEAALPVL
jgi:hypothetical protein